MTPPEPRPLESFICSTCGNLTDTPQHEMGCEVGRRERITAVVDAIENPAYAAGFAAGRALTPAAEAGAEPGLDVEDVRLLTHAVTHLLAEHDCDRHGWETLQEANLRVRAALEPRS